MPFYDGIQHLHIMLPCFACYLASFLLQHWIEAQPTCIANFWCKWLYFGHYPRLLGLLKPSHSPASQSPDSWAKLLLIGDWEGYQNKTSICIQQNLKLTVNLSVLLNPTSWCFGWILQLILAMIYIWTQYFGNAYFPPQHRLRHFFFWPPSVRETGLEFCVWGDKMNPSRGKDLHIEGRTKSGPFALF